MTGCPLQAVYTADTVRLELVELARAGGGGLVSTLGSLAWTCSDLAASAPLPYRSAGPGYSTHNKLVSTVQYSTVQYSSWTVLLFMFMVFRATT